MMVQVLNEVHVLNEINLMNEQYLITESYLRIEISFGRVDPLQNYAVFCGKNGFPKIGEKFLRKKEICKLEIL
jgi:hypothetical protein